MTITADISALTTEKGRLQARAHNAVDAVQKVLKDYADNTLVPALKVYPPATGTRQSKRTGRFIKGGYVRTFNLRRNWGASEPLDTGGDIIVVVSNDVVDPHGEHYAAKVQDEKQQRPVHRGRWTNTIQSVKQRNAGKLRSKLHTAVKQAMEV